MKIYVCSLHTNLFCSRLMNETRCLYWTQAEAVDQSCTRSRNYIGSFILTEVLQLCHLLWTSSLWIIQVLPQYLCRWRSGLLLHAFLLKTSSGVLGLCPVPSCTYLFSWPSDSKRAGPGPDDPSVFFSQDHLLMMGPFYNVELLFSPHSSVLVSPLNEALCYCELMCSLANFRLVSTQVRGFFLMLHVFL